MYSTTKAKLGPVVATGLYGMAAIGGTLCGSVQAIGQVGAACTYGGCKAESTCDSPRYPHHVDCFAVMAT